MVCVAHVAHAPLHLDIIADPAALSAPEVFARGVHIVGTSTKLDVHTAYAMIKSGN